MFCINTNLPVYKSAAKIAKREEEVQPFVQNVIYNSAAVNLMIVKISIQKFARTYRGLYKLKKTSKKFDFK